MYEHHKQPLAKPVIFYRRLFANILIALLVISISLVVGMIGYHYTEETGWLDSFHQSSMILSGMGPVIELRSEAGKWFDSLYAIFSGVIFITNIGLILAPAIHRIFHRLHLGDEK